MLLEILFTAALGGIKLTTGKEPVELFHDVAVNLASDLTAHIAGSSFHNWRNGWFTDRGALNHDIAKVLAITFKDATEQIHKDWTKVLVNVTDNRTLLEQRLAEQGYHVQDGDEIWIGNLVASPSVQNNLLARLRTLHENAETLAQNKDFTALLNKCDLVLKSNLTEDTRQQKAREHFWKWLGTLFPEQHKTLRELIARSLLREWHERFLDRLKQPDDLSVRAWKAYQRLSIESMLTALDTLQQRQLDIAIDVADTHDTVLDLRDKLQQQLKQLDEKNLSELRSLRDFIAAQFQHYMSPHARPDTDVIRAHLITQLENTKPTIGATNRALLIGTLLACPAVASIATWSWSEAFNNRLEAVIEHIHTADAQTHPQQVQQLETTFEKMCSFTIPLADTRTLCDIIANIPIEEADLHSLFYSNKPKGVHWHAPTGGTPNQRRSCVVWMLATLGKESNNTHPLVSFATDLTHECYATDAPTRQRLHEWITKMTNKLGLAPTTPTEPTQTTAQHWRLQVKVFQSTKTAGCYQIQAWLRSNEYNEPIQLDYDEDYTLEPRDNKPEASAKTIPSLLKTIYEDNVSKQLQAHDTLTVELFLPLYQTNGELFYYPFEEKCTIKTGGGSSRLGFINNVVIRSYDRVYEPDMQVAKTRWQKRWERFQNEPESRQSFEHVQCIDECDEDLHDILVGSPHTWIAISFLPPSESRATILGDVLDAGMPIALLSRQQPNDMGAIQTLLQKLPNDTDFVELGHRVCQKRHEALATRDKAHPWRHFALLWDEYNPDMLPPNDLLIPMEDS